MILRSLWVLCALLPFSIADVKFTAPAAGSSVSGLAIDMEWEDSGNTPKISSLASYQIFLCAGGNDPDNFIQLATLVTTGDFTDGNSASGAISAGLGADVENAYFLKIISAATGGSIINFSPRFSITSMTGTFPPAVQQGLKTVSGTAGPATINQISSPQNGAVGAAPPAAGAAQFGVPYTMQTGQVRYAPMPPIPGTKVTAKNASPQWPTSAYTVYHTIAGAPNAVTTQTNPITFKVESHENTGAAAGQPTDAAMQKFLNRWKD